MQLFDSHAHIQDGDFAADIDAVLERAAASGVEGIVMPAEDADSAQAGLDLARLHPGLYTSAGFHPHEASRYDDDARTRLREMLRQPEVVAVGECGLDYHYMHSPREQQIATFRDMLRLAEDSGKPLIVHVRDAWEDMASILQPWARDLAGCSSGQPLGVLHYFSAGLDEAESYYELGFLISIHTSVTFPKNERLLEVAARLPLEALVIETDSPYGAPQIVRGKRNEPSFVREAAATIAATRGIEIEEVARVTTANARRLYQIGTAARSLVGASG